MSAVVVCGAGLICGAAGVGVGAGTRRLLGRLRRGARVRAPVCELAVGCTWAALGAAWAGGALPTSWLPVLLATAWFAVATGLVDLRHHRLPDALTLPALPGALLLLTPHGVPVLTRAVAGAAVAVLAHVAVHLVAPAAMGAGDVKLAAPLGAVLAASSWPALVLAAVLASGFTVVLGLLPRPGWPPGPGRSVVPHGPSMLLAAFLVLGAAAAVGGAPGG